MLRKIQHFIPRSTRGEKQGRRYQIYALSVMHGELMGGLEMSNFFVDILVRVRTSGTAPILNTSYLPNSPQGMCAQCCITVRALLA